MRFLALTVALLSLAPVAAAQDMAAVKRGLDYANRVCSECHAVAPGQRTSPKAKAPSFQSVADTPGMTDMAINVWLHTSHPTMPNLILNADQTADLAAYIRTLRTKF